MTASDGILFGSSLMLLSMHHSNSLLSKAVGWPVTRIVKKMGWDVDESLQTDTMNKKNKTIGMNAIQQ